MSTQFQVDTQQIEAGTADLERLAARIVDDLAAMARCIDTLMGTWHGSAALGFSQAAQSWSATQRQVHESLVGLRAALGHAGTQYSEVEAANAARFRV